MNQVIGVDEAGKYRIDGPALGGRAGPRKRQLWPRQPAPSPVGISAPVSPLQIAARAESLLNITGTDPVPPPTAPPPVLPARVARKPFGSQTQKLAYAARPGYHRHWFNDIPGRLQRALEAGYAHVKDKDGQNVNRPVGVSQTGGGLFAFLMEIPEEWYQEDMAAEQRRLDEVDAAIRTGAVEGQPGKDGRYIPSRGINVAHG